MDPQRGGAGDLVTIQQGGVQTLGILARTFSSVLNILGTMATSLASSVAVVQGGVTLVNATKTIVTVAQMHASSVVVLTPTNAAAASTQAINGLFVTLKTAGLGFTVSTNNGAAAGTETMDYGVFG
jgi:hypothetical protein